MLIGAHVSTAGGLPHAVERGVERECDAIQIFHQSPRMWRPTAYGEEDFAAFREAMEASSLRSVTIHAIYLINCASAEAGIRKKSRTSLIQALRVGDGIGAVGVVLHAGARKGQPHADSMKRAARVIREAMDEAETCRILLENTAGTQGPLGRNFDELADLIDLAGGGDRLGVCIDCCHLLAAGYEIRTPETLAEVVDELDAKVGLGRLRCLHVNDSAIRLGGNRDKHAILGEGELGPRGLAAFLSEPRFEDLPALIETGIDRGAPAREDVRKAKSLRRQGLKRLR
jgi:deoxyribonuclease IV